jgi:hypothetical protein
MGSVAAVLIFAARRAMITSEDADAAGRAIELVVLGEGWAPLAQFLRVTLRVLTDVHLSELM